MAITKRQPGKLFHSARLKRAAEFGTRNNQALSNVEQLDEAALDLAESSARHYVDRRGGWTKGSDEPLGVVIERQARARENRVGRKLRSRFKYSSDS